MNSRRRFEWKFGTTRVLLGERTVIGGVLHIRPDIDPDSAFAAAAGMEEAGAGLICLGADEFAPGSKRLSEAEELRRLVGVMRRLRDKLTVPLIVDTDRSAVALRAFELGAAAIFDRTAATFDPQLPRLIAQHNAGLIVGHMRGLPESWPKLGPMKDAAAVVTAELEASLHRARLAGVSAQSLVVDPGLGAGKRREQNLEILAQLARLHRLEIPIACGAADLMPAAALTAAVLEGAHILWTSDVKLTREAADVADGLLAALPASVDNAESSVFRADRPEPAQPERRIESGLRPSNRPKPPDRWRPPKAH